MKIPFCSWRFWLLIVCILFLLFVSFQLGGIVEQRKFLVKFIANDKVLQATDSFYSGSWAIFTTLFGILGIVMGIIFPLYQSNQQEEKNQSFYNEVKNEMQSLKLEIEKQKEDLLNREDNLQEMKDDIIIELIEERRVNDIQKIANNTNLSVTERLEDISLLSDFRTINSYNTILDIIDGLSREDIIKSDVSENILNIISVFNPIKDSSKELLNIAKSTIDIGYSLVQESLINNKKINKSTKIGLHIFKIMYRWYHTVEGVSVYIDETYEKIIEKLNEANMKDVQDIQLMKQLVQIFKEDLKTSNKVFPKLPDSIYKLTKD
ncbi:MAG: hypothetical protein M9897_06335 [Brumimicrobium sp.]|nr:hypothetical protein [Brumimicrobium sp.]